MKTVLEVYIPLLHFRSDIVVDPSIKCSDLTEILVSSAEQQSSLDCPHPKNETLCHLESGRVLSDSRTLIQEGVVNGDHLIVV